MGGSRLRGVKGVYQRKYKEGGPKDPTNPCISLYPVSPGYSGQVAAEELQIQISSQFVFFIFNILLPSLSNSILF